VWLRVGKRIFNFSGTQVCSSILLFKTGLNHLLYFVFSRNDCSPLATSLHRTLTQSIASQDADTVNSLNSTPPMSNTGTKFRIVPKFWALSFRITVKAGLLNAVNKGALRPEHISNSMAL
jgi:hypothetical protein